MLSGFCGVTHINGPFGLFRDTSTMRIEVHEDGHISYSGQDSTRGESISLNMIATGESCS
jgi:hypothetical protein